VYDLIMAHVTGRPRPSGFNDGRFCFLLKQEQAPAEEEAIFYARPLELRPLTLKNEDNKAVAGVLNWSVAPVIAKSASGIQNGFVNGRQLVQNPVELDYESRLGALRYSAKQRALSFKSDLAIVRKGCIGLLPILLLFDFAAAFPSVSHAWLRAVLVSLEFPDGLLKAFDALYECNEAYWGTGGREYWLFRVISGVLQGCPLSGSLFVLAMDPLLVLFDQYVIRTGMGHVHACADDIGTFLYELKNIGVLQTLFERFRCVSGLTLKPKKSVLVLLAVECSDSNVAAIRKWLEAHAPGWNFFRVENSAKYLGLYLGPSAGHKQWAAPIAKFRDRASGIGSVKMPMDLSARRFNTRAVTVLGYVGQLVPPPPRFKSVELTAALKALGFLPNALSTGAAYALDVWGGPKLLRPLEYVSACCVRASLKTIVGFDEKHATLVDASLEGLPIASSLRGHIVPEGWDSEAFCTNLHRAKIGDLPFLSGPQRDGVRSIVADFGAGKIKSSLQGKLVRTLHEAAADEWPALLSRRLEHFREVPDSTPEGWHLVPYPYHVYDHWECCDAWKRQWAKVSRTLSKKVLHTVLKTWSNSWCTTTRLHELTVWPCIFGCVGAEDSLPHYLRCPRLWSAISQVTSCPGLTYLDPAEKLGLLLPTSGMSNLIAVASRVYHSLKFDSREVVELANSTSDYEPVMELAFELIDHFASDLGA